MYNSQKSALQCFVVRVYAHADYLESLAAVLMPGNSLPFLS